MFSSESIPKYIFYFLSFACRLLGNQFRQNFIFSIQTWLHVTQSQIDGVGKWIKIEMEKQFTNLRSACLRRRRRRRWQRSSERVWVLPWNTFKCEIKSLAFDGNSANHIYATLNRYTARAAAPQIVRMEIEFALSSDTWAIALAAGLELECCCVRRIGIITLNCGEWKYLNYVLRFDCAHNGIVRRRGRRQRRRRYCLSSLWWRWRPTTMTILRPIRFFCLSDERFFREGSDRQSNNAINQSHDEQ